MVKHPASPAEKARGSGSGSLSVSKKGSGGSASKEASASGAAAGHPELTDYDLILPPSLPFKRARQAGDRHGKGQNRGKHWKHLKQILQAENYHLYPANQPNYVNIEAPPSAYPTKKYCDITGFEAPYTDPRTKLRYANVETFKKIRFMPENQVQGYLALRNASVVLK